MGLHRKEVENPREVVRTVSLYTILTQNDTLRSCAETKGKGFGLLEGENRGKVNVRGRLTVAEGCICKVRLHSFQLVPSPAMTCLLSLVWEEG